MLLFTSFKRPADDWVCSCIETWKAAGFDVETIDGPGGAKPRIGAIMSAIRDSGEPVAGIINADCALLPWPKLTTNLQAGLQGRCILAWRLDFEGKDMQPMPYGFDAFFFDTACMPDDDLDFSIGETWWDYWFPLACEKKGAKLETLKAPLLLHKVHPFNWSRQQYVANGRRFWEWMNMSAAPTSYGAIEAFALDTAAKLHSAPQTISLTGAPQLDAVLQQSGRAMFEHVSAAQLAAMRNSTSWRVTAPLRAMAAAARSVAALW